MDKSETRTPRLDGDDIVLEPDDEGLGNVGPDEVVPIEAGDEGLGNIRPDEVVPIEAGDEGLGNVTPEDVVPLEPDDAGLGNIRPDGSVTLRPDDRSHARPRSTETRSNPSPDRPPAPDDHQFFADLVAESPIPKRGILSQTLSDEAGVRLVTFSFAAGEELSEHTAARPAIVHVLLGEGELEAGGRTYEARPGSWIRMAARTRHTVRALTDMVMALYLLPPA
jgi:quercetin dioxygenase-like cupin family protein